ncbi:MAG: LOG family protein [Anaerolineae bacterium]|nr:LOG family protein [Anaerolineae bacterium]
MVTNNGNGRVVGVLGGASITPSDVDWQHALDLGHALATAGYAVLSGGYSGVMEAASQAAAAVNGRVIGVGVSMFEQRGLRMNRWVTETVRFDTLRDRLYYIVQQPDALVALRGGVGTLSEIALAWSLMQVGEVPVRPLVLVGPMWQRVVETFAQDAAMSPQEVRRLLLVESAQDVVPALETWWAAPPDVPLRLGDAPSP